MMDTCIQEHLSTINCSSNNMHTHMNDKPPGSVRTARKVNSAPSTGIILYVFKKEKRTL